MFFFFGRESVVHGCIVFSSPGGHLQYYLCQLSKFNQSWNGHLAQVTSIVIGRILIIVVDQVVPSRKPWVSFVLSEVQFTLQDPSETAWLRKCCLWLYEHQRISSLVYFLSDLLQVIAMYHNITLKSILQFCDYHNSCFCWCSLLLCSLKLQHQLTISLIHHKRLDCCNYTV